MKQSFGANTLVYPAPLWVVCTYDKDKKPNAMAAAWGGICCSDPPCISVSLRKATYSYVSIIENEAFTINIPSEKYVKEADYFGIVSGRNEDKFKKTNLTPIKSELVNAPYIEEFPLILECKLLHSFDIGLHTMFVGQIIDVKVEETLIDKNGNPEIEKIKPVIYSIGNRSYYGVGSNIGKAFSIGKK